MRRLWRVFRVIWAEQPWAFWRGGALAVVVLLMGAALLGLSGWFITAAGAAGLAGIGVAFDVFRPSAGVRFLALGRTAARYGERLLTHDAVLRGLASLRVRLMQGYARAPYLQMARLRGGEVLNRLTADIDALDGIALRLVIPVAAALAALSVSFAMLWWLVDLRVALWSVLSLSAGAAAALIWVARHSARPSRQAERALQGFRLRVIDLLRGQAVLAFAGQLQGRVDHALAADARLRAAQLEVAAKERRAGVALSLTASFAAAGALWLGAELARRGVFAPAFAALGFFATLALAETVLPLRRGMAELGRMLDAARRVAGRLDVDGAEEARAVPAPVPVPGAAPLELRDVSVRAGGQGRTVVQGLTLRLEAGQTIGLAGRSGVGKSTLLAMVAGLVPEAGGTTRLFGHDLSAWPEAALRQRLGFLPQRAALMGGTIRAALQLGAPDATEAECLAVLRCVALEEVIAAMGGLEARLGEAGQGLSGGEARRLALARVLLRRPDILLLDEPSEGLDPETARQVLAGIRAWVPDAAILVASHRAAERDWCDMLLHLS